MGKSNLEIPKICPQCGKPFEAKTVTTIFCSPNCNAKANKERKTKLLEEERTQSFLQEKAESIAEMQTRPYLTIAEAVVLFGISKNTMHRLIKSGKIPAVNFGQRLTRVSRPHLEAMFTAIPLPEEKTPEPLQTDQLFEINKCYTIPEAAAKFNIALSSLYAIIRRNNIPKWKIGQISYVPKEQINNIFNPKLKTN